MKTNKIEFIPIADTLPEYKPQPARKALPEWYKKQQRFIYGKKEMPKEEDRATFGTIKACVPVFDAITSGYIMFTQGDVWVWNEKTENNKKEKYFKWSANQVIEFHSANQFSEHPTWTKSNSAYKFVNSFIIKTPPGYSCLITAPFQHITPYKIIDGIVDTDTYYNPINFPFVFIDEDFEGHIPAGSPMAQIIPFRREKWQMELTPMAKYEKEIKYSKLQILSHFFDNYKRKFWSPKEYL